MSDDRRLNVRASLYPSIEAAAARRHVPVASFVAMVLSEYLIARGELNSVRPTSVTPKRGFTADPDALARQIEEDFAFD